MAKHKKKRAWNMSNPLYRYLHGKKAKVHSNSQRSVKMAKHRKRSYSRGGMGGLLSGRGMLGKRIGMGVLGSVIAGVVTVEALKMFAPQFASNDLVKAGAGFVAGGAVGAVTAYGYTKVMPNGIMSVAQTPTTVYGQGY